MCDMMLSLRSVIIGVTMAGCLMAAVMETTVQLRVAMTIRED